MIDDPKERALARARAWKAANKEIVAAYRKAYYAANKHKEAETRKQWIAKNPDRVAVQVERHAPYVKDWQAKKKAARTGLPVMFEPAQVRDIYGKECWACGSTDELCIDHIIPLSRGGSNLAFNVRILCADCNRWKNTKLDNEVADEAFRASLLVGHRAMEVMS